MISPEDQATIVCYGICLLGLVFVLGGLFLESQNLKRQARLEHESDKKDE